MKTNSNRSVNCASNFKLVKKYPVSKVSLPRCRRIAASIAWIHGSPATSCRERVLQVLVGNIQSHNWALCSLFFLLFVLPPDLSHRLFLFQTMTPELWTEVNSLRSRLGFNQRINTATRQCVEFKIFLFFRFSCIIFQLTNYLSFLGLFTLVHCNAPNKKESLRKLQPNDCAQPRRCYRMERPIDTSHNPGNKIYSNLRFTDFAFGFTIACLFHSYAANEKTTARSTT